MRLTNEKTWSSVKDYFPYMGLLLIVIFFQIVSNGRLLAVRNVSALIDELFAILLGASGLAFMLSQNCIDFSIGANVGFSCALAARAALVHPYLALPVGILTGLFIGLCNGVFHAKFHIDSFIVTLAMSFVLSGLVFSVLNNGSLSVPFTMLEWDSVRTRFIVMALIVIIGLIVFEKSRIGKQCKAIGANIETARQSGVNVVWIKITGFMISGGLAGLIAFFSLIHSATASSSTGASLEVSALNAILIGGMPITGGSSAKFRSAIIGSLIMTVVSNGMTMWGLGAAAQQVVEGVIFLIAISLTFERKHLAVIK